MAVVPKTPVAAGIVLYRLWRRLPPAQRQALLGAAREHGPKLVAGAVVAAKARRARRP